MRVVRMPPRGVARVTPVAVEHLVREHDAAKRALIRAAELIRKSGAQYGTPTDRAQSLDLWLRGYLTGSHSWPRGTAAAVVIGLSSGLAEVGQP